MSQVSPRYWFETGDPLYGRIYVWYEIGLQNMASPYFLPIPLTAILPASSPLAKFFSMFAANSPEGPNQTESARSPPVFSKCSVVQRFQKSSRFFCGTAP